MDYFEQGQNDALELIDKIPYGAQEQYDYWAGYGSLLTQELYPSALDPNLLGVSTWQRLVGWLKGRPA